MQQSPNCLELFLLGKFRGSANEPARIIASTNMLSSARPADVNKSFLEGLELSPSGSRNAGAEAVACKRGAGRERRRS
jgi:hypothetical protein